MGKVGLGVKPPKAVAEKAVMDIVNDISFLVVDGKFAFKGISDDALKKLHVLVTEINKSVLEGKTPDMSKLKELGRALGEKLASSGVKDPKSMANAFSKIFSQFSIYPMKELGKNYMEQLGKDLKGWFFLSAGQKEFYKVQLESYFKDAEQLIKKGGTFQDALIYINEKVGKLKNDLLKEAQAAMKDGTIAKLPELSFGAIPSEVQKTLVEGWKISDDIFLKPGAGLAEKEAYGLIVKEELEVVEKQLSKAKWIAKEAAPATTDPTFLQLEKQLSKAKWLKEFRNPLAVIIVGGALITYIALSQAE